MAIAIEIGYHTGLRISETFALNKSDFDFENNVINITKQLESQKGKAKKDYTVTPFLKTSSSCDSIPIAPQLKEELLKWFEYNPYERVICDIDGYYLCTYNANTWIKKKISHLNIDFHFHMLRHTLSTNLYQSGIDLKTAQDLMRHADIDTTMSIYTHIKEEQKKKAINDVFSMKCGENVAKIVS